MLPRRSLVESLHQAPSIDDLVDENPSFLRRYRQRARWDLEERLEDAGVEGEDRGAISQQEFKEAIKHVKERRKEIRNVRVLGHYFRTCV